MYSSRMRTARSGSRQAGGGASASVHARIHHPPGVGLETPLARPLNLPPGCGPGNRPTPRQTPQAPPECGPGNLQGMLG